MNPNKIKILLGKFYNGETTIDEENELMYFFSSKNVPESLEIEREIFLSMQKKDSDIIVPENLNDEISGFIDVLAERETKKSDNKRLYLFSKPIKIFSVAASFIILLGIGSLVIDGKNKPKDTFTDPKEAYIETQRILAYIASNLKSGEKAMTISDDKIGIVRKALQEGNIALE